MASKPAPPSAEHIRDRLHPLVYKAIIGLTIWLVLAVWTLFGDAGDLLTVALVVSTFFFILTAIPLLLFYVGTKGTPRRPEEAFMKWASGDFDVWRGSMKGGNAAIEILLPIAAVAGGMTAFGLVLHFTAKSAGLY